MTTLYSCLGFGTCMKPWLALTQLGKAHRLILIDVLEGTPKTPEYLAAKSRARLVSHILPDQADARANEIVASQAGLQLDDDPSTAGSISAVMNTDTFTRLAQLGAHIDIAA